MIRLLALLALLLPLGLRAEVPVAYVEGTHYTRLPEAVRTADPAAFFRADEALHVLLASAAGHANAWQVIHQAKAQLDRVRRLSLVDPGRTRRRLKEHRAIVAAVVARDATGAAQAMRQHLASVFEAIDNIATDNAHYFV